MAAFLIQTFQLSKREKKKLFEQPPEAKCAPLLQPRLLLSLSIFDHPSKVRFACRYLLYINNSCRERSCKLAYSKSVLQSRAFLQSILQY